MSKSAQGQSGTAFLNDVRVRGVLAQVFVLGSVIFLVSWLVNNTLSNLEARQIATGYGFLEREAAFDVSESVIDYSPADNYLKVLVVGLLNTLKISLVGVFLATVIGTLFGIARLSSNWLIARLAGFYVEGLRNIPLLLQLFFWYTLITEAFPGPRKALNPVDGVFLSNRGIKFPWPVWETAHTLGLIGLACGLLAIFFLNRRAARVQEQTGQRPGILLPALGCLFVFPIIGWTLGGAPTEISTPALRGFNFRGGASMSPEFLALLTGLTLYTGTFIAEIVRGGISSVPWGQTEAAVALGLKQSWIMRLILLPQALRVIIPPLTSQYLNLVKNSSLAVAIGYPDLVSTANTTINQTGQAVEGIAIIMAVYLTVSLSISAFMNWYNGYIALRGGR